MTGAVSWSKSLAALCRVSGAVSWSKSLAALCVLDEIAGGNSQAEGNVQFHGHVLHLSGHLLLPCHAPTMQPQIMAACMQAACPQLDQPWLQASSLMRSKCRRVKSLQPVPHSQQPLSPAFSSLQLQLCAAGLPHALSAARHHPALYIHTLRWPSPRCCSCSRRRSIKCLQTLQRRRLGQQQCQHISQLAGLLSRWQSSRSSQCRLTRAQRSFSRQQLQHQKCTIMNGL